MEGLLVLVACADFEVAGIQNLTLGFEVTEISPVFTSLLRAAGVEDGEERGLGLMGFQYGSLPAALSVILPAAQLP